MNDQDKTKKDVLIDFFLKTKTHKRIFINPLVRDYVFGEGVKDYKGFKLDTRAGIKGIASFGSHLLRGIDVDLSDYFKLIDIMFNLNHYGTLSVVNSSYYDNIIYKSGKSEKLIIIEESSDSISITNLTE